MSDAVADGRLERSAAIALRAAGVSWFVPVLVGQWVFAVYIAAHYGVSATKGDFSAWNKVMHNGLVAGDLAGNLALITHVAMAFVITLGGTLQLLPWVRAHALGLHRRNGRVYIVTAVLISIAALFLVWTRDGLGAFSNDIAISINALLIVAFAGMAWRTVRQRRFDAHRRWALRTFVVASGVWFIRLMYGFLFVCARGTPPGVRKSLDGPTDIAVSFASYLLPLAVLELYLWAERSVTPGPKLTAAGVLSVGTVVTGIGVFGAVAIFWLRWIAA